MALVPVHLERSAVFFGRSGASFILPMARFPDYLVLALMESHGFQEHRFLRRGPTTEDAQLALYEESEAD